VLFGDFLVIGAVPNPQIRIPTLGVVTEDMVPKEWKWSPTTLAPKIAIISDQLAVAYAGSAFTAETFLKEILSRPTASLEASTETVADIMEEIFSGSSIARQDSTLFACLKNGKMFQIVAAGDYVSIDAKTQGIEAGVLAGSGTDAFIRHLKSSQLRVKSYGDQEGAFLQLVSLGASMASLDSASPQNALLHGFGGGYETINYNQHEQRFRYYDQGVTILWYARVDGETVILHNPQKLIRISHFHSAPIVHVINISVRSEHVSWAAEYHPIQPLKPLAARLPGWPPPIINAWTQPTNCYMNVVKIYVPNEPKTRGEICIPASTNYDAGGIEFNVNGSTGSFRISPQFTEKAKRVILKAWNENFSSMTPDTPE
jgi:hypothetical protein